MGFMDKAKQMAEQAQQKIEETQKQFNDGQAAKSQGGTTGTVRYDANGRVIPSEPAAQPSASEPAVAEAVGVPQPPEEPQAQAQAEAEETPVPPPAPPRDDMNATPDPFKPIQ
jgi:hypothetical protein